MTHGLLRAHEPIQLRPMGVGELLDMAFRLYRRNFWLFVGIVAVIQIPLTLFEMFYETVLGPAQRLQTVSEDTGEFWQLYQSANDYYSDIWQVLIVRALVLLVTFFAVQGLMNGAMARAVFDRFLGRPRGLVDTFRALGWGWLRLIGSLVLLGILDVSIAFLLIIPCLGWIAAPLLLVFFNVPILSLLAPVIVIEDLGAAAALGRSFRLGRRKFWRVLGVNILLWLLMAVISGALMVLWGVVFAIWDPGFVMQMVVTSLVSLVIALFVRPIWVCGLTLLYFDLRVRLEGFDLELKVAQMDTDQDYALA